MGPGAKRELEFHLVGVILTLLGGVFPNILGGLVHLVLFCAGIPRDLVQIGIAVGIAVTYCINCVIGELGRELNDIAGHGDFLGLGIECYGEAACAGQVEGDVVAGRVADPLLAAVLDDLELDVLDRGFYGVGLTVLAVVT